ncbi:MAG: 16S rRNA methyltransferase [Candidatus Asgardarchaeia archaeon]
MKELIFILADSSIETIPEEMLRNGKFRMMLKRKGKKPSDVLLDSSIYWKFMYCLDDWRKRGRPDIVHRSLLLLMDSPLNQEGFLRVYVHTVRDKVIEFSKVVRIPRTYNRFKGLMAKLLKEGAVPKDRPLIRVLDLSLKELLESIKPDRIMAFEEGGRMVDPSDLGEIISSYERPVVIVGAFPHGMLSDKVMEVVDEVVSIDPKPLSTLTAASIILRSVETSIDIFKYRVKKYLER